MSEDFYRIKRLPPYVIAEVNAMRAAARAGGEDIIDLGMGNPDLPPPEHVIEKLVEVARKPSAHGYSQSKGIPGLRKAQANYYGRRFGVDVDPETEVVVTMGSKEGLASLATAITAPGVRKRLHIAMLSTQKSRARSSVAGSLMPGTVKAGVAASPCSIIIRCARPITHVQCWRSGRVGVGASGGVSAMASSAFSGA